MENKAINSEHNLQLKKQLQELGLPDLQEYIDYYEFVGYQKFTLPHWIEEEGALTLIELNYIPNTDNRSVLDSIDITYRPPIEIEDKQIGDINTKALDERMGKIDWRYDPFSDGVVEEEMKTEAGCNHQYYISETLRQLDQLSDNKLQGDKKIAQLLMYKNWTRGYYSQFVPGLPALRKKYEYTYSAKVEGNNISISKGIEELKARHHNSLQQKHLVEKGFAKKHTRRRGHSL